MIEVADNKIFFFEEVSRKPLNKIHNEEIQNFKHYLTTEIRH